MAFSQRLSPDFYRRLHDDLRTRMDEAGLDLLLLDHPEDIAYLTGFAHWPTERPIVFAITADRAILLLPELERGHAARQHAAGEPVVYFEYPGVDRAFTVLARAIRSKTGRAGFGPSMAFRRVPEVRAAFPGFRWSDSDLVDRMRLIKRPEEIAMHREAARISDAMVESGVVLVRAALAAGKDLPSEVELCSHVVGHGAGIMNREHDDIFIVPGLTGGLVYSGPNSAYPHGMPSGYRLRRGESFMLSLGCSVGGRKAETERTFIIGAPTSEQRRLYEIARDAQERGTQAMVPGRPCSEPNRVALEAIRAAGAGDHILHRLGHGMGVAFHEPPWAEDGDPTPMEPGMILSSEPAIYVHGLGGFRLADTVLLTETGQESLTRYPRRLDDIVIA